MKFFKKKETVADTNTLFEFDKSEGCYVAEVNGIRFECYEVDKEIESYTRKLADAYESMLPNIVEYMMGDLTEFYEEIEYEQVRVALGKPIIRPDARVVSYVEHTLGDEHIIEVAFAGVFDPLTYVNIDG